MRTIRLNIFVTGLLLTATPCFATVRPHHKASTTHATVRRVTSVRSHKGTVATVHARPEGMEPERATQIQSALIKSGYMTGEPTGTWDAPTVAAMQKMQSDNGWQTKITPDSRAIIKLGLGPQSPGSASAPQP